MDCVVLIVDAVVVVVVDEVLADGAGTTIVYSSPSKFEICFGAYVDNSDCWNRISKFRSSWSVCGDRAEEEEEEEEDGETATETFDGIFDDTVV